MSADDRCTTSYVRMPPGYPKLKCSGRTPLGDAVLNDTWVSIVSGSEDYSFKVRRRAARRASVKTLAHVPSVHECGLC